MIILFGKYYGKSIQEVESSYLLYIIESDWAEWSLINECKKELSERLKIDWQPPTNFESLNKKLTERINILESLLAMSVICKGNQYKIEGYISSPELLKSDLKLIKDIQFYS